MLTAENKLLASRVEEMEKTLEERKDYSQLKKDLMDAQEEAIELNKENEVLVAEMEEKQIELEEATLQVEAFKLEVEAAYIDDEEGPVDDYKKAYELLKRKLKVYFEITSEERFGMEEKIAGLNNKLQELQTQKANVMDSLEVQQELKKRDQDIEELMQMIDSYKDSQKMIEMMTSKNAKLEEVTQTFQKDLAEQKLARESLEEELEQGKGYSDELENAVRDLEEEVKLYEEMQLEWEEKELNYEELLAELRQKTETLEQERNALETNAETNADEKGRIVDYLQDANRRQISDGESFKDRLLVKFRSKFWHFRAELLESKLRALPEQVQSWLRLAPMENYEVLETSDLRLDCVVETLFREYVLRYSLAEESPNLYVNARDLLLDVLNIKAYLALCKQRFAVEGNGEEEIEKEEAEDDSGADAFVKSAFYAEVMKNLPNIENLYTILSKGELSASYCMSHFAEAKFKLESLMAKTELSEKLRILRVLTKGFQQMAMLAAERGAAIDTSTKTQLLEVVAKSLRVFHSFENIESFSAEHVRKVETYEGDLTRGVPHRHECVGGRRISRESRFGETASGCRGKRSRLFNVAGPSCV